MQNFINEIIIEIFGIGNYRKEIVIDELSKIEVQVNNCKIDFRVVIILFEQQLFIFQVSRLRLLIILDNVEIKVKITKPTLVVVVQMKAKVLVQVIT